MTYKISYEAETVPANLPENAVVEKVSLMPLEFSTDFSGKKIRFFKSMGNHHYLSVDSSPSAELNKEEMKKLRDALTEVIGDGSNADGKPVRIIDGDGDVWFLANNGFYFHSDSPDPSLDERFAATTADAIRHRHGIKNRIF